MAGAPTVAEQPAAKATVATLRFDVEFRAFFVPVVALPLTERKVQAAAHQATAVAPEFSTDQDSTEMDCSQSDCCVIDRYPTYFY